RLSAVRGQRPAPQLLPRHALLPALSASQPVWGSERPAPQLSEQRKVPPPASQFQADRIMPPIHPINQLRGPRIPLARAYPRFPSVLVPALLPPPVRQFRPVSQDPKIPEERLPRERRA